MNPESETLPLDDAMISVLQETGRQLERLQALQVGALMLFLRQQGLQGNWRIAENGKEIVRETSAVLNGNQ